MTEIWLLLSSMSSMTPSGPHSFSGTVPGGATRAPGGTQPAADEKISARFANNVRRRAKTVVIAALIAGFAYTSQATRVHCRARNRVGNKRFCSGPALKVYVSCASARPPLSARMELTMTQTLFALAVLAIGPAIPQTAVAQQGGAAAPAPAAPAAPAGSTTTAP